MLRYALICIIAFMFICGKNTISGINYQPALPFSSHLLQEVADFDSIVEPESDGSVIEAREVKEDEENSLDEDLQSDDKCPRCAAHHQNNTSNATVKRSDDDIKKELGQMGNFFVNRYFNVEDLEDRYERKSEENEEDNIMRTSVEIKDPEFIEEQSQAQNLTNSSKVLYDTIENPPLQLEKEHGMCCDEDEKETSLHDTEGLTQKNMKKGQVINNDFLEMHFFKYSPETEEVKVSPQHKKSVLIDLYPEQEKDRSFTTPEKYDYIALLSNINKNLVQVPAIKFTVVPTQGSTRRKRSDHFAPFYVSKYKKQAPYFRFEPTDNIFRLLDNGKLHCHHWSHVPILFINTIPGMHRKFDTRLSKRSSNFDVSDNQYLRQADLLIQNVNTSLRMGLVEPKGPLQFDSGVLINPKYQNPIVKTEDKRPFKKEASEKNSTSSNNAALNLVDDYPLPLAKNNLVKNDVSSMEAGSYKDNNFGINPAGFVSNAKENNLAENNINTMEVASGRDSKNNPIDNNFINSNINSIDDSLSNNEINSMGNGFNDDSWLKNDMSAVDNSLSSNVEADNSVKNEINPTKYESNIIDNLASSIETDNLIKNTINSMEQKIYKDDTLIKNAVSRMEKNLIPDNDKLIKNEISSMESGDDGLVKNEISPISAGGNKDENLIKHEISPTQIASSFTKNVVNPSVVQSSKSNNLVKGIANPLVAGQGKGFPKSLVSPIENGNLVKNVVNPVGVSANKNNDLVKNAINPLATGLNKDGKMIKSVVSSVEGPPGKHNSLVKSVINPKVPSGGKSDSLVKNAVHPMQVSSNKGIPKKNEISSFENGKSDSISANEINGGELVTSRSESDDSLIKNEVNPVIQSNSVNNFNSESVADPKNVENLVETNGYGGSGGRSENLVGNNGEVSGNDQNKNEMMSNAYLLDLLRNVDMLKKSDPNFKLVTETEEETVTCATVTETAEETTTFTMPDLGFSLNETDNGGISSNHTVAGPIHGASTNPPKMIGEASTRLTPLGAHGLTHIPTIELNKTSPNEETETDVYEDDDNEMGNILDLLETNMTTVASNRTNSGENTTSPAIKCTTLANMSVTSIPTIASGNSSATPVTATVAYETSLTTSKSTSYASSTAEGIVSKGKSVLLNKLHNLQKDLKLVFEVQNILSGSKKDEEMKNKRSKREIIRYNRRSRRKCKKGEDKSIVFDANLNKKMQEVAGLGKILEWKANGETNLPTARCNKTKRFLFRSKRKKKKKKKKKRRKKKKKWWKRIFGKPTGPRHFLGTQTQNLL